MPFLQSESPPAGALEQSVLLDLLEQARAELLTTLRRLDPPEWRRDFGVRNPIGQPLSIERQVEDLSDDYEHHTRAPAIARAPS